MLVSFAFRNPDDVKKKVMRIREGGSNADICLVFTAGIERPQPDFLFSQYETSGNRKFYQNSSWLDAGWEVENFLK